MAEQTYEYTALSTLTCDSCKNLSSGDTVDIVLDQALIPALPSSIRGIVQLVDDLTYTLQYDDSDLNGAAVSLSDSIVTDVTCVSELTLAQEYSDSRDDQQDTRMTGIEDSLSGLGVIPSDGDNRFVIHPDSTGGVSVAALRHDKMTVVKTSGSGSIVLNPTELASPLAVNDLTGLAYRIEAEVSALAVDKSVDNRDSSAQYAMVGEFNNGATVNIISLSQKDSTTITATKVGNNLHINVDNASSGDLTVFVTSKFRILS